MFLNIYFNNRQLIMFLHEHTMWYYQFGVIVLHRTPNNVIISSNITIFSFLCIFLTALLCNNVCDTSLPNFQGSQTYWCTNMVFDWPGKTPCTNCCTDCVIFCLSGSQHTLHSFIILNINLFLFKYLSPSQMIIKCRYDFLT